MVVAWAFLLTGMKFLGSEKFSKLGFGMDSLQGGIMAMLMFYTLFLNVMGVMGGWIAYRKTC